MASIVGSSVSFKPSPLTSLNSSSTSKIYAVKPTVSFWRTNAPSMPALRVICAAAKPETVETVISVVKSQLALNEETAVSGESKFSDLGADSLDTVEIVMKLEEHFGITVNEDSAQTIITIDDAAELIEGLKN
ncbi:hypothetical protein vseg_008286 [Gypsophila vaccaria]